MDTDLLSYFLLVARKRKRRIALLAVVALVGLVTFARYLPTEYEATIKIYSNPEQQSLTPALMPSISFGSEKQDIYISYQESLLRSYPIFTKVQKVLKADVAEEPPQSESSRQTDNNNLIGNVIWHVQMLLFGDEYVKVRKQWRSDEFRSFRGRISVSRDGDNGNIIIGFTDSDADRALTIANALAKALIELNLEIASDHAAKTAGFLSENMNEVGGQLRESGQMLERFVTENNYLGSEDLIDKRLATYFDEQRTLQEAKLDLIRTDLALKSSTSLRDSLKRRLQESRADTSTIEAEAIATELKAYESSLALQKANGDSKTNDQITNKLQRLKNELERLSATEGSVLAPTAIQDLLVTVEREVQKAELENTLAKARLNFAEKTFNELAKDVQKLPGLQRQVAAMTMDYNQKMKITELLAEQYINAQMRAKVSFSKLFVLEDASLRTDKVGTSKGKMFGMMMLVLLGLVIVIVTAIDYLRGSIFNKTQITHNKAHMFLGSIEHIADFGKTNLALKCRQNDAIMRMAYQFSKRHGGDGSEPGRVVSVVSNLPMAGKSFTTLALGVGLSARGHSVCIIDGDFRAKSRNVRNYIDNRKQAINQPINTFASVEELAQQPASIAKPDSLIIVPLVERSTSFEDAQTFLHGKFKEIMETLKDRFDYIILDGPPLTFLESLVLVEHATALVVCLPEGAMTKRQFDYTLEVIEPHRRSNARVFTIMTNCTLAAENSGQYYRQYQERDRAA